MNDLLRQAHDDTATLRRELVNYGFMTRDRGIYRLSLSRPTRGLTVAQEVDPDEQNVLHRLISGAEPRPPEASGG